MKNLLEQITVQYSDTRKRVEELEKKRGKGDQFKQSPLSPEEEKEFVKKRRKVRIWDGNKRGSRKK